MACFQGRPAPVVPKTRRRAHQALWLQHLVGGSPLSPMYFGAAYAAALCLADRISALIGAFKAVRECQGARHASHALCRSRHRPKEEVDMMKEDVYALQQAIWMMGCDLQQPGYLFGFPAGFTIALCAGGATLFFLFSV